MLCSVGSRVVLPDFRPALGSPVSADGGLCMLIVQNEVVHQHGDGETDDQHPAHRRHGPHHIPQSCGRVHVAIAHGCHGDDGPPAGHGDAAEHLAVIRVVNEGGEEQHADAKEHQEQQQLLDAGFERVEQDPQAGEVTHQPEDAEHPQQQQESDDAYNGVGACCRMEQSRAEVDEVGEQRQQVKDGHGQQQQLAPVGRQRQAHNKLQQEEDQAHGVHVAQGGVRLAAVPQFRVGPWVGRGGVCRDSGRDGGTTASWCHVAGCFSKECRRSGYVSENCRL